MEYLSESDDDDDALDAVGQPRPRVRRHAAQWTASARVGGEDFTAVARVYWSDDRISVARATNRDHCERVA